MFFSLSFTWSGLFLIGSNSSLAKSCVRRSLILLGTWKNVSSTGPVNRRGEIRYVEVSSLDTSSPPILCSNRSQHPQEHRHSSKLHGHVAPHSPPSSALEFVRALHPYTLAQARYLTMRMKIYQITLSDACFRHSDSHSHFQLSSLMRTRLLL